MGETSLEIHVAWPEVCGSVFGNVTAYASKDYFRYGVMTKISGDSLFNDYILILVTF